MPLSFLKFVIFLQTPTQSKMNRNLSYLYQLGQKKERRILGLMSGTSLDGLDLALCNFQGAGLQTRYQIEHFSSLPYPRPLKEEILEVFSQENVKLPKICLLHQKLAQIFAQYIQDTLQKWGKKPSEIDCIASHGQTIYHLSPGQNTSEIATLQIADGDHIAHITGILTFSDFRQKQVAAGGEGAPLAIYGDYLLFSNTQQNRILLNIGGMANFTYLPASQKPQEILATDCGPGNRLIDSAVQKFYPNQNYDDQGQIANQGKIHPDLLAALKNHPFFSQSVPKTTGPELFNWGYVQQAQQQSNTLYIAPPDLVATLSQFTIETISESIYQAAPPNTAIYVSGGGAYNLFLMQGLAKSSPQHSWHTFDALGVPADAKEALLFAMLANETLVGEGIDLGAKFPKITMGKISFPG